MARAMCLKATAFFYVRGPRREHQKNQSTNQLEMNPTRPPCRGAMPPAPPPQSHLLRVVVVLLRLVVDVAPEILALAGALLLALANCIAIVR